MSSGKLDIVILGLSITSSWGNGHATTYRSLLRGLHALGHRVLFLERNVPWYASNRDVTTIPHGRAELYESLDELRDRFTDAVRDADLVIVGSFVPDGTVVSQWVLDTARGVRAFYDIDTPVTLAMLESGDRRYLHTALMPQFDLYLSFTGGPMLRHLENRYGARNARALYCSVDEEMYRPDTVSQRWALAYLGTYSPDRQPTLERLLFEPARQMPDQRFAVAGAQFPATIQWPENIDHTEHLAPGEHRAFYCAQRFTLNVTRADMIRAGYSPSVRLFEAAACGVPIISDAWPGLEEFFEPGREILVANRAAEVLSYLRDTPEQERLDIGTRARERTLARHTSLHRAEELLRCYEAAAESRAREQSGFRVPSAPCGS